MNNRMIPTILSAAGVIFMMAMAFKILPSNVALFISIACFILSGVSWNIIRQQDQNEG
jgi:hypothetical protein